MARIEVWTGIPRQADFWESSAKYKAYVGGLGAGKTFAGAVSLLMQPAGTVSMVVAPTYKILEDATIATTRDLAQRCKIEASWNEQKKRLVLNDGSLILFRSGEKPDRLRGPNIGHFWIDEGAYCKDQVWRMMLGRLRLGPATADVTTTPNGKNWVWKRFVQKANDKYAIYHSPTYLNPYNADGYADDLIEDYPDHLRRQEVEGEFLDDVTMFVIPEDWWNKASAAWRPDYPRAGHMRLAIDLAKGSGGDRACLLTRDENAVRDYLEDRTWDKVRTAKEAGILAQKWSIPGHRVSFDIGGLGEDFHRYLRAEGIQNAVGYRGGHTAHGRAANLRSYAACMIMGPRFDPSRPNSIPFAIPPAMAKACAKEASELTYSVEVGGIRALERKTDYAARLGFSPDGIDTLIQSFAFAA